MILFHQERFESSYIPDLRANFKAYDADFKRDKTSIGGTVLDSDNSLSPLRNIVFDSSVPDTDTLEKHETLVLASYDLQRTRTMKEVLYTSSKATSKSKSLWLSTCLLARLRVAFIVFKNIALTLPSFQQLTIR